MKAIEVTGTVDDRGQLSLNMPLTIDKFTRVRVIVLFSDVDIDQELLESPQESFRQGWHDVKTGNVLPVSRLWDGIDNVRE
jgi:hypothetical protein